MTDDPYSLDRLHDIVELAPVSRWPPAVGWWLVAALIAIWVMYAVFLAASRRRERAYRRAGLRLLDGIESAAQTGAQRADSLVEISAVMKRVALAAFPRQQVASLSGDQWLAFLNRTAETGEFTGPPASLVAVASSETSHAIDAADFADVCQAARDWVRQHEASAGGELDAEEDPSRGIAPC